MTERVYAFGHRHDPVGHRRTPYRHVMLRMGALVAPVVLALAASVLASCPPVMDQGPSSSCGGHATACAITTSCAAAGTPLPFVVSPGDVYMGARCLDRAGFPTGASEPLADDGCEPNQCERFVTEWGVRSIQAPVSDPDGTVRYSDVTEANVNDTSALVSDMLADAGCKLVGPYEIDPSNLLEEVRHAIDIAKAAVTVGCFADKALQRWTSDQAPLGAPDFSDPKGGWHDVTIVAYRWDAATSGFIFTIRNSWGESYGDRGNFEATEAWLRSTVSAVAWPARRVL